ncbi:hypothetical protein [Desulfobulbus sp.]|uniref:hypothetical protein n=1 Tax=Desulfobulbus sp. TaxID=895 RepID=UPI00286F23C7|nr:hypothetical protein [Desulfobulbus sp.]
MNGNRYIPWFNPREMDDQTMRALSTGQDELLADFFVAVRHRLRHPGTGVHWLVTGPRGAGKSFFLRLVQSCFFQELDKTARFVLLPEEHSNIAAPHELLREIERMLSARRGDIGLPSAWRVKDEEAEWTGALRDLLAAWSGPLLVVGVENFDQLMQQAFADEVGNARLRSLLANEPRLMFLATSVQGEFDEQYDNRFFRQFEHRHILRWDEAAHRLYLGRRAELQGKEPTSHQLARIEAYSRYTGGNARVAAVLASAILDEQDPLLASADLSATLDRMTDYYRALFERIPPMTRKLFDALIRGGEPCSQTELAERVGARQSDISRAFAWLIEYGYVREERQPGSKKGRYLVADRLFVQFYRMRYLQPGQRTQLALLTDLLTDIIEFADKWRYAERYFIAGHEHEARTMVALACRERSVDIDLLPSETGETAHLVKMGQGWEIWDAIAGASDPEQIFQEILRCFPDDASLRQAYEEARALALANVEDMRGVQLIPLLENSQLFCPAEIYWFLTQMLRGTKSKGSTWHQLIDALEDECENAEEEENDHERHELGRRFPLAASLQAVIKRGFFDCIPAPEQAIHWAVRAAVLWSQHQQPNATKESLLICFTLLEELKRRPYRPEAILASLALLEAPAILLSAGQSALWAWYKGLCFQKLFRFSEALDAFDSTRQYFLETQEPKIAALALEQMAECHGGMGRFVSAIDDHRQARMERLNLEQPEFAAWNLGQMARHTVRLHSLAAAWELLDQHQPDRSEHRIVAWQQQGDAIQDCVEQQGVAQAFALGRALLEGVAARPQYPAEMAVRALWIDMIVKGVPFPLLRDLLAEVGCIFADDHSDVPLLCPVLIAWLDDLESLPAERGKRRQALDPDLATTFAALEKHLDPETKARLHLDQKGTEQE